MKTQGLKLLLKPKDLIPNKMMTEKRLLLLNQSLNQSLKTMELEIPVTIQTKTQVIMLKKILTMDLTIAPMIMPMTTQKKIQTKLMMEKVKAKKPKDFREFLL